MRRTAFPLLAAGIVVGLLAEWTDYRFADPGRWVPDLVVGWTLIAAGVVAGRGRPESRIGALLVVCGFTWFLGNFADAGWERLAWIGVHGVYVHRGPLMHALLTFPTGRPSGRVERVAVTGAYLAALVTPVWSDEWMAIALAAALVIVAVWRHAAGPARERRARRTAMWLTVGVGAIIAGGAAARLGDAGDFAGDATLLAYELMLCVTAVGLAGGLLARPWERGDITDLVVELGEARSDTLRDALARTLGDPTLELGFWSPTAQQFIDADGRPLALPAEHDGRASTVIETGGGPVAVLVHHRSLLDDPALVESVGAAARLASANARLQAELQAQVAALNASRRRVVSAGDDEHRRLEARLRAGAEQRLDALAARIADGRAAVHDNEAKQMLADVEQQLAAALDELRVLAAGLHPRLLTDAGLAGALEALACRCPVPVRLVSDVERLPDPIEVVVYFVCSEALANVAKHAAASRVDVTVGCAGGRVGIEVVDDGVGGADPDTGSGLRNLTDRVEALGGSLRVADGPRGGTRLVAELPLGDETG